VRAGTTYMTLNLLYMMSSKDIFVFLKNYYMLNIEICSNFQTVPYLNKCMCALVLLNVGIPSSRDWIQLIVQFCPCMDEHSFDDTLDSFDCPCMNDAIVMHRYSENVILNIPPQEGI
jgi:hypothetical protein